MKEIRSQTTQALRDELLQENLSGTLGKVLEGRARAVAEIPNWEELRDYAERVKLHTLNHLPEYLEQFEARILEQGGTVLWAKDAAEASGLVVELARDRRVRQVVKSKTMLGEEIGINPALEAAGIQPLETDLGEFIVQLARENPAHLIAPALHKSRAQIGKLFSEYLGCPLTDDPKEMTRLAREHMRGQFLSAKMGITGVNFGVVESGTIVIVENEGNVRLTTSLPPIHVALMGIERLLPNDQDLAVFLKLLVRSATGQRMTSYVNFLRGSRQAGELDGPKEFYLVLIDNGRSRILDDPELRATLHCIRCGACQNICPVFQKIGGHAYNSIYQGPIGAILTPQIDSVEEAPQHPFASSLCGACEEICPVKIPIPRMLLELRSRVTKTSSGSRTAKLLWMLWAWAAVSSGRWRTFTGFGRFLLGFCRLFRLPPLARWLRTRDFPKAPRRTFRQQYTRKSG